MRVIEQKMLKAVKNKKNWKSGNTQVYVTPSGDIDILLYGNLICRVYNDGTSCINLCGYNTTTTRSRLTALFYYTGIKVRCKNFTPYGVTGKGVSQIIPSIGWIFLKDIINNQLVEV